jgi:hypothetical protein
LKLEATTTEEEIEVALTAPVVQVALNKAAERHPAPEASAFGAAMKEWEKVDAASDESVTKAGRKQSEKAEAPPTKRIKGKPTPPFLNASDFSVAASDYQNQIVKSKSASRGNPFPSPAKTDGGSQDNSPVKGHFKKQEAVLQLARCGPERRMPTTEIRGLVNPRNHACYINSVLTLLTNLDPFTGYLNRVHRAGDEPEQSDLLTLLDDFARAYWTTDVFPDSDIEYPAALVKDYVRNLPMEHSFGIEPFIPNGGEEEHEDAVDYLIKVLQICSTQLRHGRKVFGEGHGTYVPPASVRYVLGDLADVGLCRAEAANFSALIEPVFQKRQACAGTGTVCANKKVRSSAKGVAGDLYCPVIGVSVEEDTHSLQNAIAKFMKYDTELYCSRCKQFPDYKDRLGRFWNSFIETPEILFIRVNRLKYINGRLQKKAWPLHIPDHLDLSEYLDKEAKAAGVTAQYRLSGVVSHAGSPETGHYISYVKHHAYDDEWVRIDDELVLWSSFGEAVCAPEALARYKSSFFPYLLAYTKVHRIATDATGAANVDGDSSEFSSSFEEPSRKFL